MRLPGHKDEKLLATTLAALDQCRNGTVDTFRSMNITTGNEGVIIDQFNVTGKNIIQKRDSDDNGPLPCPAALWVGELASDAKMHSKG